MRRAQRYASPGRHIRSFKLKTHYVFQPATAAASEEKAAAAAPSASSSDSAGGFTVEEVKKHNTKDDCWVIIDGKVLDVTSFLPDHPGGEKAILLYAGRDATEEFNMLHDPKVRFPCLSRVP